MKEDSSVHLISSSKQNNENKQTKQLKRNKNQNKGHGITQIAAKFY